MSKILLAIHDESVLTGYTRVVKASGNEPIIPSNKGSVDSVVEALSQRPDKVVTEINYGFKGTDNSKPFQKIEEEMRKMGYNTQTQLLGVSALPDLVQRVRRDYNLPVADKYEDSGLITKFLFS